MTAIWLLSTRGRPKECQATLDACEAAGMTSPGVVYVDETVGIYRKLRLPDNWTVHPEPVWGSLQASMSWCLEQYPDATAYGWLADDVRPQTVGWDKQLEAVAGDWCLSYGRDMWLSESDWRRNELEDGDNLSSGLCWGGELVRTVGWWALPGVRQAFIDVAWCRIVGPLGLARYTHEVIVEHLNYRTGKRDRDQGDDWTRGGDDYIERDIEAGYAWLASEDYDTTIRRLGGAAARQPPTDRQVAQAVQRLRDNYANAHWKPGRSGASLTRILADFDASGRGDELAQVLRNHPDEKPQAVDPPVRPVGDQPDVPGLGADHPRRRRRPSRRPDPA